MKRNSLTRHTRTPTLHDSLFRNLDQFLGEDVFSPFGTQRREALGTTGWMPPVDIRETDDAYEFTAELPGLGKDDVKITMEDKVLTLAGERAWEGEENRNDYHRVERAYGTFSRSFTLPNAVDSEKVEAKFKNGILTVSIPKAEEIKPRQIKIN